MWPKFELNPSKIERVSSIQLISSKKPGVGSAYCGKDHKTQNVEKANCLLFKTSKIKKIGLVVFSLAFPKTYRCTGGGSLQILPNGCIPTSLGDSYVHFYKKMYICRDFRDGHMYIFFDICTFFLTHQHFADKFRLKTLWNKAKINKRHAKNAKFFACGGLKKKNVFETINFWHVSKNMYICQKPIKKHCCSFTRYHSARAQCFGLPSS